MKHTPGPWAASSASSVVGALVGASATDHVAAVMPQADKSECEANARLIAAAPDLLEVSKRILRELAENNEITVGAEEDLAAAIKKAEESR